QLIFIVDRQAFRHPKHVGAVRTLGFEWAQCDGAVPFDVMVMQILMCNEEEDASSTGLGTEVFPGEGYGSGVQMFDAPPPCADRQKGITLIGNVTEHVDGSGDHLFQFGHKPFPIEIPQSIADEVMRDAADSEGWKRLEVAHQNGAVIQDIEVRGVI